MLPHRDWSDAHLPAHPYVLVYLTRGPPGIPFTRCPPAVGKEATAGHPAFEKRVNGNLGVLRVNPTTPNPRDCTNVEATH